MAECEERRTGNSEPLKLSELLDRGWKIFEEVDSTSEPLGSQAVQARVKLGLSLLEDASDRVRQLGLFSCNEELEELSTKDLRFMLLPALLGALTMKISSPHTRLSTVITARGHFMHFLKTCKDYNVSRFDLPKMDDGEEEENRKEASKEEEGRGTAKPMSSSSDLVSMAAQRQAKIERYRQRKELESRLSEVRKAVDEGRADDEVRRDFYLLNIRRWISLSLEEVESIDQEAEILRRMDGLKHATGRPQQPARPPMKPFILTKGSAQAQVFGAGYPSLPTMTVDEWFEQHKKHGVLPDQGVPMTSHAPNEGQRTQEEDEEAKAERDDEAALMKARNWDDWKDSHRRGYGNRQNMG